MYKLTGFGALGAGLGVALGWLCCLPFAAALGAGVAAAGAVLTPLQPYMVLASVLLLALAFVQTVRAQRCKDQTTCNVSAQRRWLFLAAVTVATALLITVPYWSAPLIYRTL